MTALQNPGARLTAVAECVRGEFLCDVGTDHAFLPIYLCRTGKISRAIASDINKGPLLSAEKNIRAEGLEGKIQTVLSDGLSSLENFSPTDIAIAGMGGILIKEIIEKSASAKRAHLILQPMSHAHILRKYLISDGFEITAERLVLDSGKVYQIICADFTGKADVFSDAELYLGRLNIERRGENPELFAALLQSHINTFSKKVAGGDSSAATLYGEFLKLKGD